MDAIAALLQIITFALICGAYLLPKNPEKVGLLLLICAGFATLTAVACFIVKRNEKYNFFYFSSIFWLSIAIFSILQFLRIIPRF